MLRLVGGAPEHEAWKRDDELAEGDTVYVTAKKLDAALRGRRLLKTDFRVPAFATVDLSGQVVLEVVSRGKHLLLRTDEGITVHTHLKMDGRWDVYPPGGMGGGREHEIRLILQTAEAVAVGRRLGITEVFPTGREAGVLGHLGPDVLGPDWDPVEVVRRLRLGPDRAIGDALIDQRVMAGPGNIYRCEACFLRGLEPWTTVRDVTDVEGVVDLMKGIMEANRTTGRQITTGDPRPGRRHWVYGRAGSPCRRCGTAILRRAEPASANRASANPATADRVTFWCPTCQPSRPSEPASDVASATARGSLKPVSTMVSPSSRPEALPLS